MPRCGHESRIAKALSSLVRPTTNGTSSSIAVTRSFPRTALLRIAGYQKSHKNPASFAGAVSPAPEIAAVNVRAGSLIVRIVVHPAKPGNRAAILIV